MICPECGERLVGDNRCDCGWARKRWGTKPIDPNHDKCAWKYPDGLRCTRLGTIGLNTTEPQGTTSGDGIKSKMYCSWHYECVIRGLNSDYRSREYAEWYLREKQYAIEHGRKNDEANPYFD